MDPDDQQHFRAAYLQSPIPTYLWRKIEGDFAFEETNHAGAVLGHDLGQSYAGRVASDAFGDRPSVIEAMHGAWRRGESAALEFHGRSAAGREQVFRLHVVPLPPHHLVIYLQDLSVEQEREAAIREAERRYRLVVEEASDGIVLLRADGTVEDANPATRRLLGVSPDEPIRGTLADYLPEEDLRSDPIRLDLAGRPEGLFRERRILTRSGSLVYVEVSARQFADGYLVLFLRDVTARRERDAALRRSEEQHRRMIELSPDAILVHSNGAIVYANEAAVRLVGEQSRDDMIGKPALHYLHPDCVDTVEKRIRILTEERRDAPRLNEKFVRVDGTVVDVEVAGLAFEYEGRPAVQVIARDISERVRHEEALQSSEERYRGLFEGATEAICRLGVDGRILAVNPATTRITGWSEEELQGTHFSALVHPEDRQRLAEAFAPAIEGKPVSAVFRIVVRDGSIAWLETTTTPELQDGKAVAFFGLARDITEARRSAEQLADRERLLATVLDQLPVGVLITDAEGTIVRSNPVADEIWNGHRTHAVLVARKVYRGWWAETGRPLAPEEWASSRALTKGEVVLNEAIEIESFDGSRKTILNSAVPLRDEQGAIRGALILNQDITEQRVGAQQREVLAARLRQVISSTSDGLCTVDAAGNVTLMNPAAATMLGWREDEVVGRNLHAIVHDAELAGERDPFLAVMQEREARPLFADRFRTRSGRGFDAEVSCAPIVADASMAGAVIAFRDVTTRKALERELERTSRLSSLGQLAATIAHEFNNVMMGIMPYMDVIIRRTSADESLGQMAGHIKRALARGKQITSEILRFAQSSMPVLHATRVVTLLDSVVDELRVIAGRNVEVRIAPIATDLAVAVDPAQMQQVFTNLVTNARDAMAGNGVIEISAGPGSGDVGGPIHAAPDQYVRISVRDHGVGMDEITMQRMFEPLFTTKRSGGTGLGLALVQQVLKGHRGFVSAESQPGRGTVFHLSLPRCAPPEDDDQSRAQETRARVQRVLIVEDDESVAAGLEAVFEMQGVVTRVVNAGKLAVAAAAEFVPDAVVLDRGLPDVDGVDVCRALLARWPELPIVFSTGHGGRGDLGEMLAMRNIGYLLKPYEFDALLDLLNNLAGRAKPS